MEEMDYNERGLTGEDIADIALAYWRQLYPAWQQLDQHFSASKGWCTDFKRRWGLKSGMRLVLDAKIPPDKDAVGKYRTNIKHWAGLVFPQNFLNLDETKWHYVNPPRLVIYRKGY